METQTMPAYKKNDFYIPRDRGGFIQALHMLYPEHKRGEFENMSLDQLRAVYINTRRKLGR